MTLSFKFMSFVLFQLKIGVLKFCGSTDFASGQWAGIELNDPIGKNDGSVAGVRYFTCKPKYGKLKKV